MSNIPSNMLTMKSRTEPLDGGGGLNSLYPPLDNDAFNGVFILLTNWFKSFKVMMEPTTL